MLEARPARELVNSHLHKPNGPGCCPSLLAKSSSSFAKVDLRIHQEFKLIFIV